VNRVDFIFEALRHKMQEAEEACVLAESDLEARSFNGSDPQSEALLTDLSDLIEENTRLGKVLQVGSQPVSTPALSTFPQIPPSRQILRSKCTTPTALH
jgi:hypothetical protein